MIDYSLGCILANVPVSYDEFKMKFICLKITLRPLHGEYEKNHGLKVNFSVRPLHEAALYTVIYGMCLLTNSLVLPLRTTAPVTSPLLFTSSSLIKPIG